MKLPNERIPIAFELVAIAACLIRVAGAAEPGDATAKSFRGALLSTSEVTELRLGELKSRGYDAVALALEGGPDARQLQDAACEKVRASNLALYYWVEVARCPELADANPSWMASLQGHSEWRRLFATAPTPGEGEVVKAYPWVPILHREGFDGQMARVKALLADRPETAGVFLNDLQGGPSACGCGNHLCRWTSDYGTLRTTTPLESDAAAKFVAEIEEVLPGSRVIPVWTTECEEHDGAKDGLCAGVGCYRGICWRAYTEQLMPIAAHSRQLGVLLPYRAFQRDLKLYGEEAGWITHALKTFQTMPALHGGSSIVPKRLIAVLQGWDVTDMQVAAQVDVARRAGVAGTLVAFTPIEQDWEPKLAKIE